MSPLEDCTSLETSSSLLAFYDGLFDLNPNTSFFSLLSFCSVRAPLLYLDLDPWSFLLGIVENLLVALGEISFEGATFLGGLSSWSYIMRWDSFGSGTLDSLTGENFPGFESLGSSVLSERGFEVARR